MGPMPVRLLPLLLLISCPASLEAATSINQISSPRGGKVASFLKKIFGTKSDAEENDIRTHGFWSSGFHAFGQPHAGFPIRSSFDRPAPHHGAVTPFTGGAFSSGSLVVSGGSLQLGFEKGGSGQLTLGSGSSWQTPVLSGNLGSLTLGGSNLLDLSSSDFTLTWNIIGWDGLVFSDPETTESSVLDGILFLDPSLIHLSLITFPDPDFNSGSASPIITGPVPEPSAVLLALAGATAFFRRRRH